MDQAQAQDQDRLLAGAVLALAVLAAVASAVGLLAGGGPGPHTVDTLRGGTADLYGTGLYRWDTWLIGAGNRGTDAAVLVVELPLLLAALAWCRRGDLRGRLLLAGALGFFVYWEASQSLATAYNHLFLVYVSCFSLATFAFARVVAGVDQEQLVAAVPSSFCRRGTIYLGVVGALLTLAWLPTPLGAALTDTTPELVQTYTTGVTWALDLGLIVPLVVIAAVLLHRRRRLGVLLAVLTLLLNATLGISLIGQGMAQIIEDVPLTAGEKVGVIGSFAALTLASVLLTVHLFRTMRPAP